MLKKTSSQLLFYHTILSILCIVYYICNDIKRKNHINDGQCKIQLRSIYRTMKHILLRNTACDLEYTVGIGNHSGKCLSYCTINYGLSSSSIPSSGKNNLSRFPKQPQSTYYPIRQTGRIIVILLSDRESCYVADSVLHSLAHTHVQ
jgi:hypothetical protein